MVGVADIPCLGKIVDKVSDYTVEAVFRGLKYMFCYKSLVDQLNSETGKLNDEIDNMSREVKKQKDNGKTIKGYVLKWQDEAEELKKSAEELSPSCSCIQRLPIPNPVSRFRIGRNAAKKATTLKELTGTGKDYLTGEIAYLPPVENIPKPETTFEEFQSRKDTYRKLYDALVNQDSPLVHGIYGMPGVGKTRMMENFWEDAVKEKVFDNVVRVNVGNENLDKIMLQKQIAGRLNCQLESQDVESRASQLEHSLRNGGKILLILDDVWIDISLKDIIGTPFGGGSSSKGSKILFTSREKDVLEGNNCEHLVEIKTLSPDEALYLFKKAVGTDTINSLQDESLVKKVCDECGHLPLLIHAVGKALKGHPHTAWVDAQQQLQMGKFKNIDGVEKVHTCIKLSIDMLKQSDAKLCLFLCSLFPEDAYIDMKMLVQLATGSGLIHSDAGESRVLNMVDSLKASSLLLDSGRDYAPKVHDVIRDVARSMASTDSNYVFLHVKCNSGYFPSDGAFTAKLLRLDMDTADVHFDENLVCPDLHTLWLQSNRHPQKFSGGFFTMFEKLSSLMLENVNISLEQFSLQPLKNLGTLSLLKCDMSMTDVSFFPEKLKTLWIYECYLPSPLDVANLKYLRKLKIQNLNLVMAPNVISNLSSLEELHIPDGFSIDNEEYKIEPTAVEIGKLTHLRSLQFSFPTDDSLQGKNALSNLDKFDILVGRPERLIEVPRKLSRGPSMRSIELIGNHWKSWESLIARAEEVKLSHSDVEVSSICNGNKRAFEDLKRLFIKKCDKMGHLASVSSKYTATCFSKLTILDIKSCSKLEYLFCNNIGKCLVQLQELRVSSCESMKAIIVNDGTSTSQDEIRYGFQHKATCFSKLTILDVDSCSKLKYLFCNNVAKGLVQLQELRVSECESMEAIIINEGTCDDGEIINFSNLKSLTIVSCRRLASFYAPKKNMQLGSTLSMDPSAQYQPFFDGEVRFPSLEKLNIESLPCPSVIWGKECYKDKLNHLRVGKCDKLEILIPQAMLHKLHNLEHIHVYECGRLRTMFPPSVALDLTHLEELKVENCEKMREIIETGEQVITADGILFPQLSVLRLHDLPCLTSFWCYQSGKPNTCKVPLRLLQLSSIVLKNLLSLKIFFHGANFEFHVPELKEVKVESCGLSTLFTVSMFRKFQLENLEILNCELLENIFDNSWGDETCNKIITLSQLTAVALENLPNLKSCFHNANYEFHMPVIKKVKVHSCGLSNTLFTRSIFKNLKQLEELRVCNCELLESIFEDARADESPDTSDKIIILNQVSTVHLEGLPKFQSIFYGATYQCYMPALKNVIIVGFRLSVLFTSSVFQEIQQLERLYVSDCESLEHIVKEVGGDETSEMNGKTIKSPKLSSVTLDNLPNLKSFFHNANYELHRPVKKKVKALNCGLSNTLFTRSFFKNLKQLEELKVRNCKLLESIFEDTRSDQSSDTSDKIITLNQVSTVYLEGLPKLESIFYGATYECYMPALKYVTVVGCGLSVLFTSSVFREIQQLTKLYVSDCESLEHIVEEVGVDETSEVINKSVTFSKLYMITLTSLPNLKSFSCSPSYVFNIPKLSTFVFSSSKTTPPVRFYKGWWVRKGIDQGLNDYIIRQKQLRGSYASDSAGESSYSSQQQLGTQSEGIEEEKSQETETN